MKEDWSSKFKKILYGGIVIALFISLNGGYFMFFILSVICTLGAGLIAWGFLAYLIGSMILLMVEGFIAMLTVKEGEKVAILSKEQRALVHYIRKEKGGGVSEQEIILALKDRGWTEDEIAAAINMC